MTGPWSRSLQLTANGGLVHRDNICLAVAVLQSGSYTETFGIATLWSLSRTPPRSSRYIQVIDAWIRAAYNNCLGC